MKKVLGGLTVLVILSLVLAGCNNITGPGGDDSLPKGGGLKFNVDGLPTVNASGTGAVAGGEDDTFKTGNSNWETVVKFFGNKNITEDLEKTICTPIHKKIPIYEWKEIWSKPEEIWSEAEEIWDNYANPIYGDPEPIYGDPEPIYGDPEPIYGDPEPIYGDPIPIYNSVPEYETVPIYEPKAVYKKVPIYNYIPIHEWAKVYNQEPVFGPDTPIYPDKPVFDWVEYKIPIIMQRPSYEGSDSAWAGWNTDAKNFPHNTTGTYLDGVIRTGKSAWAMAVEYKGEEKKVLLVQGQHTPVGFVKFEPVEGKDAVKVTIETGDNIVEDIHLGYYKTWQEFQGPGNGNLNGNKLVDKTTQTAIVPYSGGTLWIGVHCQARVYKGLEDYIAGYEKELRWEQVGFEPDTDAEPEDWIPGDKIGEVDVFVGWEKTDKVLITLKIPSGKYDKVLTGYEDVIVGYKDVIIGYKDVIIGYKPAEIIGYKPAEIIGYKPAEIIGYKPAEIIGYKDAKIIGYKPAEIIGYKPAEIIGYGNPVLIGYTEPEFLGMTESEFLYNEKGDLLYYKDGKIIGFKKETIITTETKEVPMEYKLLNGNDAKQVGEVYIWDNGDGTIEVTYLFYNGANPKSLHAIAVKDIKDVPNGPGQYNKNGGVLVDKPVLTEERTYTVTLTLPPGTPPAYVAAHASF